MTSPYVCTQSSSLSEPLGAQRTPKRFLLRMHNPMGFQLLIGGEILPAMFAHERLLAGMSSGMVA